jgi:hypothetical protein
MLRLTLNLVDFMDTERAIAHAKVNATVAVAPEWDVLVKLPGGASQQTGWNRTS